MENFYFKEESYGINVIDELKGIFFYLMYIKVYGFWYIWDFYCNNYKI